MTSFVKTTFKNILTSTPTLKYLAGFLLLSLALECSAFGTLFTSPQQREALDQQRAQGENFSAEPKPTMQTTISPNIVSTTAQKVFFNGYVIRKSGPNTAWANQKALPKTDVNKIQNGISARLDNIEGTSVPVKISALSNSTRLQPGQFLNKSTGEITESYHIKRSIPEVKKSDVTPSSVDTADHNKNSTSETDVENAEDNTTELE